MKKRILMMPVLLAFILLFSACDDITRNLNIFSIFNPEKTTEEKLESASYYMLKQTKTSYSKALSIYQEIKTEDPANSDALYGYATAYAKYNEVEKKVVGALPSLLALRADLQSTDIVNLFERLYETPDEVKLKQLATYNISKEVSDILDALARDVDNEVFHGRIKSQDVWLDAVIAYIHRCHSTITTYEGEPKEAIDILDLVYDPDTNTIEISIEGLLAWADFEDKVAVLNAAKVSLQNAISILALHTGLEGLEEFNAQLDNLTAYFDDFIDYMESL